MFCFKIPTTVNGKIEHMMANFWWGADTTKTKIHWTAWSKLKIPKSKGGMGFRDLTIFNKALMAKQVWRMTGNPEHMVTKFFKARYFKHMDIMEAILGTNQSYVWRSLLWSKDILQKKALLGR